MILLFLIILGIGARLYRVSGPPTDHHSGRQYETAAMARNFAEGSMDPLYPQVDWGGDSGGYVEAEFPIYTYGVALLYRFFGPHEGLGRALSIVFYALSAILLFLLSQRLFDVPAALIAVFLYTFAPLSLFFTRTIQPDALAALCTLAGIYCFWLWTENERWFDFVLAAVAVSMAVLIKPANLYLGLPLLYLLMRRNGPRGLVKPAVWLFAVLVLAPFLLWYRHAYGLWETYGNTLFRAYVHQSIPAGSDQIWLTLAKRLVERLLYFMATPPGLLLLCIGLVQAPPRRNYLLHWWAAGFGISILLAADPHAGHDYYQLPLVFVVAAFVGHGGSLLLRGGAPSWSVALALGTLALAALSPWVSDLFRPRWWGQGGVELPALVTVVASAAIGGLLLRGNRLKTAPLLAALSILGLGFGIWQTRTWFLDDPWLRDRSAFGQRVQNLTEPDSRIVFLVTRGARSSWWYQHRSSDGQILHHDPVDFYLSHRKGWSVGVDQITPALTESLRQRGAKYLAYFVADVFMALPRHPDMASAGGPGCSPVEVDSHWGIYRLKSTITATVAAQ